MPAPAKTHYYGAGEFKVVTGVALDGEGKAFVPNTLGKNIKQGFKQVLNGTKPEYASTKGRIGAARQINSSAFPEIERLLEQVIT